jgi:hypothetical protein
MAAGDDVSVGYAALVQVLALSVLSNGLLVPSVRDATWALWQHGAVLVGDQLTRLAAGDGCWSVGRSSRKEVDMAKTLYGLISNLCNHTGELGGGGGGM